MEKTTGESSDSEVYLSADEGLTSSRGSEKAVAVPRCVCVCVYVPLCLYRVSLLYVYTSFLRVSYRSLCVMHDRS